MIDLFHDAEFWVGIGFVLTLVLLAWKGAPKLVGNMLDQRAAVIAAELDEAKRLRAEAQALLDDYQAKFANAEREAQGIATEAQAEAERFAAESRASLKTQIERRAQAAQDKIAQAESAALAEIRALAADMATAAAEKLIAARMDEKRAGALIEGSIKSLDGKLN